MNVTYSDLLDAPTADWLSWFDALPCAVTMAACVQDATWHAEGDVLTHTKMVFAELERLGEWPSLTVRERAMLRFVALFHDAGKPATTVVDPETGRTHAPKHAVAGAELARSALRDLGCDLATREAICALVRYHGRPPHALTAADPREDIVSLSVVLSHRLLGLFATADLRGRVRLLTPASDDGPQYWMMLAEELGSLDSAYPFANDHARFIYFRGDASARHRVPFEDYRCTVTMTCGVPGAGKDTWLRANMPDMPVVSLDDIRQETDTDPTDDQGEVLQTAREMCRSHLRASRDFAFNATNTVRRTRRQWVNLFAEYGARVEMVYVEPPLSRIFTQNRDREERVPRRVIEHLLGRLEVPTTAEAHGVRLVG